MSADLFEQDLGITAMERSFDVLRIPAQSDIDAIFKGLAQQCAEAPAAQATPALQEFPINESGIPAQSDIDAIFKGLAQQCAKPYVDRAADVRESVARTEYARRNNLRGRLGGVVLGAAVVVAGVLGLGLVASPERATTVEAEETIDGEFVDTSSQNQEAGSASVETTAPVAVPRPAVGEQSAVLVFDDSMCNEEVSVREATEEYFGLDGANEEIINSLEIDPTPQLGCDEGTRHVEEMRAQGKRNRTREDPRRFVISEDMPKLPQYPDGSYPTNSGQLLPVAQRNMAGNDLGERGIVYIDGHRSTGAATFALLDNQEPGDEIVAYRWDGEVFTYVVDKVESVPVEGYQARLIKITKEITARTGNESILINSACDPYADDSHRIVSFSVLVDAR